MKKTAIILFTFLFILTSCSNPEDTKMIQKLDNRLTELNNQLLDMYEENNKLLKKIMDLEIELIDLKLN